MPKPPPPAPRESRWLMLGRALPRQTRERAFEPALYDTIRGSERGRGTGTLARVLAVFFGSAAIGVWRAACDHIRITVGLAIVAVAVTILAMAIAGGYGDQATPAARY